MPQTVVYKTKTKAENYFLILLEPGESKIKALAGMVV
jgi:hypothetical protein